MGGHPQVVVQSPPGDYESQRLQEEPRVYGLPPTPHWLASGAPPR